MDRSRIDKLVKKLERGIVTTQKFFDFGDDDLWKKKISDDKNAWTMKDLVGHFIAAENHQLRIAINIYGGGDGAPKDIDIDETNQGDIEKFTNQISNELVALMVETRTRTIEWVSGLDINKLDNVGNHPTLGIVDLETVIFSIYAHQLMHLREIKSYLSQEGC